MSKILILTSKTGGGHVSLAQALRDQLSAHFSIEIVDPQPRIIHWHYRLLSRHALWLWAAEFKVSDTPARALAAHKSFTTLFARNVAGLLRRTQPDLVITTYPFLTYEVTQAMRQINLHCPFVMLFTDPNGVHQSWLTERGAAATFAPTHETHTQALAAGFVPQHLHFTGWPVRGQFYGVSADIRAQTLNQLNLPLDKFTVFLQGGGEGAAKFAQTVNNLLAIPNLQIILAAGTNRALFDRFSGIENVRPLGFTSEIAPYMAAADVVVGKAGPNMLFESVTLGKPFIATTYIPGQEEVNLEFIQRHQLGWVALKPNEQRQLIQALANNPAQLQAMSESVNSYRQWNTAATQTILPLIQITLSQSVSVPAASTRPSQQLGGELEVNHAKLQN
jgi:processive 1,2-diacylglycerol beta-glucosyltransferase